MAVKVNRGGKYTKTTKRDTSQENKNKGAGLPAPVSVLFQGIR